VKWVGSDTTTVEPWDHLLPGSEKIVANFHTKYPNMLGPPSSYKPKLVLLMMGSNDLISTYDPLSLLIVGDSISTLSRPEGTQFQGVEVGEIASASGGLPVTAYLQDYDDNDVVIHERDAWLIDVAGAPSWRGGVMSRSDSRLNLGPSLYGKSHAGGPERWNKTTLSGSIA
jgi:hypothetical protein